MTKEDLEEPEATTGTAEHSSGERSDTRDERRDDPREGSENDIPLNIVGHEDRNTPDHDDSAFGLVDDYESAADSSAEIDADDTGDLETGTSDAERVGEVDRDDDVQPVELLVQLAKDGEIDPWDIDIVRVTDKFLEALDDADLRTSGRALFYASVLLRMKSDELFTTDEPAEEEIPPWEAPFADEGAPMDDAGPAFDPVESLEEEMERRLERKHARGKPETLDELVRDLREAERGSWWKESRSYDTSNSPRGWDRGVQELSYHSADDFRVDDEPTADDVTHTAHEEDIESVIEDVEAALAGHYDQGREEILYAEIDRVGGTRMMTYLALLFLAHRGSVRLEQDELFGDLWIQQVTVDVEPSEAIAD